jgi:hypothetical protein
MLWRAWHLRNDAVHTKGKDTVAGSAGFLASYVLSLHIANDGLGTAEESRGKEKVYEGECPKKKPPIGFQERKKDQSTWKAPPLGWVNVNIDAAYCPRKGEASVGVVVRDHHGNILLSTWRTLHHCGTPEEAKAEALLEGIRLAT